MCLKQKSGRETYFIILSFIVLTAVFALFPVKIFSFYFLFLIFFIAAIFLINHKLGFFMILLVRPLLDTLTGFNALEINRLPFNVSAVLAIAAIIFSTIAYLKNRAEVCRLPLKTAWLIFLALAFISIFISTAPITSFAEWTRILSVFALFILGFLVIKKKRDFIQLLSVLAYSVFIPSILALYQFITATGMTIPFEGITNRIYGTFAHPNLLAYYLVFAITVLGYLVAVKKKYVFQNSFLLAFYGIILALTFTRGAWLALILVFFIIGAIKYRGFLVIFALVLLLIYATVEPIQTRVNDLWKYNPDSSIEWRKSIWKEALVIGKEKPALGHGAGTASLILLEKRGPENGSSDPHNDYLKLFIENGAAGVTSYGILILSLLYFLIKKFRVSQNPSQKDWYLTLFSLSLAIFALSFVDNILRNTVLQWASWAVIGGTLSISINLKNKNKDI